MNGQISNPDATAPNNNSPTALLIKIPLWKLVVRQCISYNNRGKEPSRRVGGDDTSFINTWLISMAEFLRIIFEFNEEVLREVLRRYCWWQSLCIPRGMRLPAQPVNNSFKTTFHFLQRTNIHIPHCTTNPWGETVDSHEIRVNQWTNFSNLKGTQTS